MDAPSPDHDPRRDPPLRKTREPTIRSLKELQSFLGDAPAPEAVDALAKGDRLGMQAHCSRWLTDRCYMLDLRRLIQDSLAHVVVEAPAADESQEWNDWLRERIEVAGQFLLEKDRALARENPPLEEPIEPRFLFLMDTLQFTPDDVRIAAATLNGLSAGERHVFHHCFVQGKGFGRYEEEVGVDALHAKKVLLEVIDKLSDAVGDE